MSALRFRQVHLDFHTSPLIPGIGKRFDKSAWRDTLLAAAVNSITLFSKCHHGWSYHPTSVGKIHPHLDFDLLRAQFDATKEAGINAPVYLSAGLDNLASAEHPEWREVDAEGRYAGWTRGALEPGFHTMDFHSPYLDYLCGQIREAVRLFPSCDGIFLDIISQNQSCGHWSLAFMKANGLDPEKEADRRESSRLALESYYRRTTEAARSLRSDMPVFHNAGHIARGQTSLLRWFSHLELESLPTGGWGYDHFPLSAKYACNLPLDFLGMTGKFHTTWGEFGGFKHPNALRYECAAMLAFGSKCSVGDQLHPSSELDRPTYEIIGSAYREVRDKEPWCVGARQVFDIGVLSSEAEHGTSGEAFSDEGACRILLEGHFLFGVIDRTMDFGAYKVLVLPDDIRIDEELKLKLDLFLGAGGKLVLSAESGLCRDRDVFAFDVGADYLGLSPNFPPPPVPQRGHDYMLPRPELCADFAASPQIVYARSHRIRTTRGTSLGDIYDPFFNRTWDHFCSHQHAPGKETPSGFDCGVRHGGILYFAHPVFREYREFGAVVRRHFLTKAIRSLLSDAETLRVNLPSTARVTLTRQISKNRHILHLLYAPTALRGGAIQLSGGNLSAARSVEVIEDLPALGDVEVSVQGTFSSARLVPQNEPLPIEFRDGSSVIRLPGFSCHQMVELVEGMPTPESPGL